MNLEEHQHLINEEQEAITDSIPLAKKRYDVCRSCEYFNTAIKICKECYCFMAFKVRLDDAECPRGKW